jgi:hypothetical protein
MAERESSAAIRRVALLLVAFAGVIGMIFWMKRSVEPAAEPSASPPTEPSRSWEADLIRSVENEPRDAPPKRVSRTERDKQKRDHVRDLIYKAYGFTPPKPGEKPPRGEKLHAPLGRDAATISPEYIRERVREDFFPLARECYEAALEAQPKLAGKLVISFVIVGDDEIGGVVDSAELTEGNTIVDEELVTCMLESMLSMSFEAPSGGGSVTVTYPFLLSPGDGG